MCLWAFDRAKCLCLYCQPSLMTINGTEQILRVSKNLFPPVYRGVCCFTSETVNQSKVKVKSWWMNNSRPLRRSQNKCGINYWGVVKFVWGGLQQLRHCEPIPFPPHMMSLCGSTLRLLLAPLMPVRVSASVHVVRLSIICSPLVLRFANKDVPTSFSDVH